MQPKVKLTVLALVGLFGVAMLSSAQTPLDRSPWWRKSGHDINASSATNDQNITWGSRGTASGGSLAAKTGVITNLVTLTNTVTVLNVTSGGATSMNIISGNITNLVSLTNTVVNLNFTTGSATTLNALTVNLTNGTAASISSLTNSSTIYKVGATAAVAGTFTNDVQNADGVTTNRTIFKDGLPISHTDPL